MRNMLKKIIFPATIGVVLVVMSLLMIRNYETVNEISRQGKSPVSIITPGAPGKAGESAYEIAVRNGYKGSETEWLATLIGLKGDTGEIGPIGPTGAVGSQGPQGENGTNGTNGRTPELGCADNGARGSTIRWKYTDETDESAWRTLYTVRLATCS